MQDDARQGQAPATGDTAHRGPASGDALREAGQELRSTAAEVGAQAGEAASRLRDEAAGVAAEVKAEASGVAEAVQERAAGFAEEQKRAGAEQAEGLARAVHRAADELQDSSPQLAHYVREAAASTNQLAQALQNRSLGELVNGVEDFARRQPVAFFGATVLAGFALARFVKSSAESAGRGGGGQAAAGGSAAPAPRGSAMGAPGWVPASGGPDDTDPTLTRPATMAAASLGGAAARQSTSNQPGPGRSS
jgi:hypothetical protein